MLADNAPKPILGDLTFIVPDQLHETEKPYELQYEPNDGFAPSNYKTQRIDCIPIHDIRPLKGSLSLDCEGWIVGDLESRMTYEDFWDEEKLRTVYGPEVRDYLLKTLGARAVYFHECVLRRRPSKLPPAKREGLGEPVQLVHADYTSDEVSKLIGQLCLDQADMVRKSRYLMLNVWKPLRGPLHDWPLAVCDLLSVDSGDLIALDEVHAPDVLESYLFHYNSNQKWRYLRDQKASELLIFKTVDSKLGGAVPHGSFQHPEYTEEETPRESIELRTLVVY